MAILTTQIVAQAAQRIRVHCVTCNKDVEHYDTLPSLYGARNVLQLHCHGAREQYEVDDPAFTRSGRLADSIPRRAFLRNWAEYRTTIKPERRRIA